MYVVREQFDRNSSTMLDGMLSVQKSSSDKIELGYVKSGSFSLVTHTNLFLLCLLWAQAPATGFGFPQIHGKYALAQGGPWQRV